MRPLSAEEAALWARVTETIRPLSRSPAGVPPTAEPQAKDTVHKVARQVQRSGPPPSGPPAPPSVQAPLARTTLDGTWDKKLRGGTIRPDRVVDLHGRNLDQAWRAIDTELERALQTGDRVVLLITGHERAGEPPIARGAIRAAVHDWLAASRHSARIAAVRAAHRRHGGGGSLYIILRRR